MTNSKINFALIAISITILFVFSSCKKHDHDDDHNHAENELITTVKLMLVDSTTKDTLYFKWSQVGGPGTAITVDTIKLNANNQYNGFTFVLDESKNPAEDKTSEIRAQAKFHQFTYITNDSNFNITITDYDTNNPPLPLGLTYLAQTKNTTNGLLNVKLYHFTEDHKTHTLEHGSTDISVNFPFVTE